MSKNCLIVIDVQNDFCPGGALEVNEGDKIIDKINILQEKFSLIIYTQDWHPINHKSFASNHKNKKPFSTIMMNYGKQVLWPNHCVKNSKGSHFHPKLKVDSGNLIIRKGSNAEIDSYSVFFENDRITSTGLIGYLKELNVTKVYMCGLAFDYCVYYSALDAKNLNLDVFIIEDACKGINLNDSYLNAYNDMLDKKINIINSDNF